MLLSTTSQRFARNHECEKRSTVVTSGEFPKLDDEYPSLHPLVLLVSLLVSDKPWSVDDIVGYCNAEGLASRAYTREKCNKRGRAWPKKE